MLAKNTLLEETKKMLRSAVVEGTVRQKNGKALGNAKVVLFSKAFLLEKELASTKTDEKGGYKIAYSLAAQETESIDLIVRVLDESSKVIATSSILFNASHKEVIDLMVGGRKFQKFSEYENYINTLSPFLTELQLDQLDNANIYYLQGKTQINEQHLTFLSLSAQLQKTTGVTEVAFYAFARQGLPLQLSDLLQVDTKIQELALREAVKTYQVPLYINESIDSILTQLHENLLQQTWEPLSSLLNVVIPEKSIQKSFIKLSLEHKGFTPSFRTSLRAHPELKKEADNLDFAIQLDVLTGSRMQVREKVLEMKKQGTISSLQDLAKLTAADWLKMVEANTPSVSRTSRTPSISLRRDTQKDNQYVDEVMQRIQNEYPTAVFSAKILQDPSSTKDQVTFFKKSLDFDITTTPIETFFQNNPKVREGIDKPEELKLNLKAMQRISKLTFHYEEMQTLMKDGIHSSYNIVRMGKKAFTKKYESKLNKTAAIEVYKNAELLLTMATLTAVNYEIAYPTVKMQSLPQAEIDVPNLTTLFGSLDFCDCKDCRSVYSPAAYLADILQFLEDRYVAAPLFGRRSDIGNLHLTCENTNVALPYIDLVNEIFEDAISPSTAIPSTNKQTIDSQEELVANPAYTNQGAYQILSKEKYPWILPFDFSLEEIRTYLDKLGVLRYEIMETFLDNNLTEDQLGLIAAEYLELTPVEYKMLLGFDMSALGVFIKSVTPWTYWGLKEKQNTIPDSEDPTIPPTTGTWVEVLKKVPIFLQRARLNFEGLLAITNCQTFQQQIYANPLEKTPSPLVISNPASCTLRNLNIENLTPTALEFIARFVRLWRKLNWTLAEFDKALISLPWIQPELPPNTLFIKNVHSRINDTFIRQIAEIQKLKTALNLPIPALLSFWGNIDTVSADLEHPSLYNELFQNKTITSPLDPAYVLQSDGNELKNPNNKISDHKSPILAALNISETDLDLLNEKILSDQASLLTLKNLSNLYRHVVLAKAMRLSISDFFLLKEIIGLGPSAIDPFNTNSPENVLLFIKKANQMKASGFTPVHLDYLLRHRYSTASKMAASEQNIGKFLKELWTGLQKIDSENPTSVRKILHSPFDPHSPSNGSLTEKKLAELNWTQSELNQAIGMLSDIQIYKATLQGPMVPAPKLNGTSLSLKNNTLSCIGPLTEVDYKTLSNLSNATIYQIALKELYDLPRNFIKAKMALIFPDPNQAIQDMLNVSLSKEQRFGYILLHLLTRENFTALEKIQVWSPQDVEQAIAILFGKAQFESPLAALPSGVVFPKLEHTIIFSNKALYFTGCMTQAEKQTLTQLSTNVDYRRAVNSLFQQPRNFIRLKMNLGLIDPVQWIAHILDPSQLTIEQKLRFAVDNFRLTKDFLDTIKIDEKLPRAETLHQLIKLLAETTEYSALLKDLPKIPLLGGASQPITFPDSIKNKIVHLQEKLFFKGPMNLSERTLLLGLSSERFYQRAINSLFQQPREFIISNLQASLDTGTAIEYLLNPSNLSGKDRLDYLYKHLYDGTTDAIMVFIKKKTYIIQKLSEAWKTEMDVTERLLNQVSSTSDSVKSSLFEFLHLAFIKRDEDHTSLTPERDELCKIINKDNQIIMGTFFAPKFETFILLEKIVSVLAQFKVTSDEIQPLLTNIPLMWALDLKKLPVDSNHSFPSYESWERLVNLLQFRHKLPDGEPSLFEILDARNLSKEAFIEKLCLRTSWPITEIECLLGLKNNAQDKGLLKISFPSSYDVDMLLKLCDCFNIMNRLGVSAAKVSSWMDISSSNAREIKNALKAKYTDKNQWLSVAKLTQSELREKKRNALLTYLLTKPLLNSAGQPLWHDAAGIYAHFLIDPEMSACQMTSRIKQAISSVQLFVQRSFLGLEPEITIDAGDDDWHQWETWMKNYRVWEANRKIFLYPENWLEPDLRDNMSSFYKDVINDLAKGDITNDLAETALMNYITKLEGVARLEICGIHQHWDNGIVWHVFGRTQGTPHVYYYRQKNQSDEWTAWERIDVDISGDHLLPFVWNNRLYLFWAIFTKKADEKQQLVMPEANKPVIEGPQHWEIQLAWSQYRNKKWSPKNQTTASIRSDVSVSGADEHDKRQHRFLAAVLEEDLVIWYQTAYDQSWRYDGGDPHWSNDKANPILEDSTKNRSRFRFTDCNGHSLTELYVPIVEKIIYDDEFSQIYVKYPGVNSSAGTSLNGMLLNEENNKGLVVPSHSFYNTLLNDVPGPDRFSILSGSSVDATTLRVSFYDVHFAQDFFRTFLLSRKVGPTNRIYNRFSNFYHPYAASFIQRLSQKSIAGLMERDFQIEPYRFKAKDTPENILRLRLVANGSMNASQIDQALNYLKANPTDPQTLQEKKNFYTTYLNTSDSTFLSKLVGNSALTTPGQRIEFLIGQYDFASWYQPRMEAVWFPFPTEDIDFSREGAYSLYNWELFFHIPLLMATRLNKNQRFEEARKWFHYIFDPTDRSDLPIPQRYWKTGQFFNTTKKEYVNQSVQNLLQGLNQNTPDEELSKQVSQWREHPFEPHLLARMRTVAYQKMVVMKYIDNLIDWADQLFRRDTLESINEAAMLYLLAAEILGKRPQKIPPRVQAAPQTYNTLKPLLDSFSNAFVIMENLTLPPKTTQNTLSTTFFWPLPSLIFTMLPMGFYFSIPKNDKLLSYWDTIEDRFYKIRHCMNIEGVVRQLPLFEPPIDPAFLVRATAAGMDLGSALNDLNAPLPHYRFTTMIQKALELCAEVKALGASLLSILEKKDAEELALLRSSQEISLLETVRLVKESQVSEAIESAAALNKSYTIAALRWKHYNEIESWTENAYEQKQFELAQSGLDYQTSLFYLHLAATVFSLIPEAKLGLPPTCGATFGGSNITAASQAFGSALNVTASMLQTQSSIAGTKAGYDRREAEWALQRDLAAKEMEQIDKQISAANKRITTTNKELENLDHQKKNAIELSEFMHHKYTNQELYEWMLDQASTLYFQVYQFAYDVAKRAERSYRFELGLTDSNFIQFGYWDSLKKGLLAGDKLHFDLKRLEMDYLEKNKRQHEITKHISLSMLSPTSLIDLKETGACWIDLPESLFDMDYPGHYMRRIKNLSITIPCVVGPYTSINCTLTLVKHQIRKDMAATSPYARTPGSDDLRFIDSMGAVESVVTSGAQNDSGLFELNFRDERYLPFEGAGAISLWRLEMPKECNAFAFNTISDVILHLKYTARDAGGELKGRVMEEVVNASGKKGIRLFNVKREFPTEWYQFLHPLTEKPTLKLKLPKDKFPFQFQNKTIQVDQMNFYWKLKSESGTASITLAAPSSENPLEIDLIQNASYPGMFTSTCKMSETIEPAPEPWSLSVVDGANIMNDQLLEDLSILVSFNLL